MVDKAVCDFFEIANVNDEINFKPWHVEIIKRT